VIGNNKGEWEDLEILWHPISDYEGDLQLDMGNMEQQKIAQ
jgi:hypothetical protein